MKNLTQHLARCAVLIAAASWPASVTAQQSDHDVDAIVVGQADTESGHNLKGEQNATRPINGTTARFAESNGWFSYELKVLTNKTQDMLVKFVNADGGAGTNFSGLTLFVGTNRLVAGMPAAGIQVKEPGVRAYPLATRLLRNGKITVKFQGTGDAPVPGVAAVRVVMPEPTIASMSTASSPRTNYAYIVNAVNDQRDPTGSFENVNLKAHFDWWPVRATNTWVQYDFAKPAKVSAVAVYWWDDSANRGGCQKPKSWQLLYRQNGEWKPVAHASGYGCERDQYNRTTFDAVETDGLRLDVQLPDNYSAGVMQWKVE